MTLTFSLVRLGSKIARGATPMLLLALISCASSPPPPAEGAAEGTAAPEAASPPPATPAEWKTMDKPARTKYMQEVVMPKMKALFVAFDEKEFAGMNCKTCHGSGVGTGSFAMPNPELPQLPTDHAAFEKWAGEHPKMTEFMATKVKPEMAKLLGMPEFDMATKTGFGCGGCHAMQK